MLLLLALVLLHFLGGFLGELLAEEALDDLLLAGAAVADHDQDAAGDVAADGAAEDDGCEGEGTHVVVDAPSAGAEGDLEEGVAVEEDDDCDEEAQGKGAVGVCFVGLVKGMGFGEFVLVVHEFALLGGAEHGVLVRFILGDVAGFDVSVELYFAALREVVFVLERGEVALLADLPS